jgi:hypothetical protein
MMTAMASRTSDIQEVGVRLLRIGGLAAIALVVLGFVTGAHGMVDFIAVIAGSLALVGGVMWCLGYTGKRAYGASEELPGLDNRALTPPMCALFADCPAPPCDSLDAALGEMPRVLRGDDLGCTHIAELRSIRVQETEMNRTTSSAINHDTKLEKCSRVHRYPRRAD